jgi:hypothetical protein
MRITRTSVRYAAAALAATMAGIYYLIALGVLEVVDTSAAGAGTDMFAFGMMAGSGFLLGAILLAFFDRRILWILGAVLQVLVFSMYLAVSSTREPAFELWGIALRVLQVPLFAALVYLAWRAPEAAPTPTETTA